MSMNAVDVPDQLIYAFAGEEEITGLEAYTIAAGLARVLTILRLEHAEKLEARADIAYEKGVADAQARFSQEIAEAYARGAKDAQALMDLGF